MHTPHTSSIDNQQVRLAFVALIGFFVFYLVLRFLLSDAVKHDDTEQLVFSQNLAWGYHHQPPLYTWLQAAVFKFFGINIFSLTLFKNLLLFSAFYFVYLSTVAITHKRHLGILAMFSLFMIPQIIAYNYVTHSILLLATSAASLFVLIKLFETQQRRFYALFGFCMGLGFLSKYTYLIFLLSLLTAALTLPDFRRAILNRKIFITLALFLLVIAPHAHWMLTSASEIASGLNKLGGKSSAHFTPYLSGLFKLSTGSIAVLALPLCIFLAIYAKEIFVQRKIDPPRLPRSAAYLSLLTRCLCVTFIIALCGILFFGVNTIKDRWLAPLAFYFPILLVLLLPEQVKLVKIKYTLVFIIVIAMLAVTVQAGRTVFSPIANRSKHLNIPYSQIASALKDLGFTQGVIVADHISLAGNLRLSFQDSTVMASYRPYPRFATDVPWLLIWEVKNSASYDMGMIYPREIQRPLERFQVAPPPGLTPVTIEVPYYYQSDSTLTLQALMIPAGTLVTATD